MNGKFILILALSAAAATFAGAARADKAPVAIAAAECASGYHVYGDGSCQPDNMTVDSRCPDGFNAQRPTARITVACRSPGQAAKLFPADVLIASRAASATVEDRASTLSSSSAALLQRRGEAG